MLCSTFDSTRDLGLSLAKIVEAHGESARLQGIGMLGSDRKGIWTDKLTKDAACQGVITEQARLSSQPLLFHNERLQASAGCPSRGMADKAGAVLCMGLVIRHDEPQWLGHGAEYGDAS